MMNSITILESLKIEPTDGRLMVLKMVLTRTEDFTIEEICNEKDEQKLPISTTSLTNTLRLLRARKLIIESGSRRSPHRGRPELLFKIDHEFLKRLI